MMRKTLLLTLVLSSLFLLTGDAKDKRSQPQPTTTPALDPVLTRTLAPAVAQTPSPSVVIMPLPKPSGLIIRTSEVQGQDVGARINAADKALGARMGWILVDVAGELKTRAHISKGHKLKFGKGRFSVVNSGRYTSAILLEDDTAIYGSGMKETFILESRDSYAVISSQGMLDREAGHDAVGIRSNITLAGFTVEGRNMTAEGGVNSTIQLGNAHNVHIYNVGLRDTTCLGITAGGTGLTNKHAENWIVEQCLFEGVASQNLNVVNGQKITFRKNIFLRTGKICGNGAPCEGVTPVDVEPNTASDVARDIVIEDNLIDSSQSPFLHGNGIVVQNGARANFGNVVVRRNRLIAWPVEQPPTSVRMTSGIWMSGVSGVLVTNNYIARAAHSGIRMEGCSNVTIERNTLVGTGTGGILSFEVMNTTDSRIAFNVVQGDPNFPWGMDVIKETGSSDRNIYEGNTAKVYLSGKASRIIGARMSQGTK
jgi:parallel beta-helix repeat protein